MSVFLTQSTSMDLPRTIILSTVYIVPLILVIIAIAWLSRARRNKKRRLEEMEKFEEQMNLFVDCEMANLEEVQAALASFASPGLDNAFDSLCKDSDRRFNGEWMPPLAPLLSQSQQEDGPFYQADATVPAISIAFLGLLSGLFTYLYIRAEALNYVNALAFVPVLISLCAAAYLLHEGNELSQVKAQLVARLRLALTRALPIFNDHAGISRLIGEMTAHESAIDKRLDEFNKSAERLASGDFSEGICTSVRSIMSQEVAPPITQASKTLGDLAQNLDRRQMTGMEQLSGQFSHSVTKALAQHLEPLRRELQVMNQLMGQTHHFVQSNIQILEKSRDENIRLNHEISESLKLMTLAKNDLANEMLELTDNMRVVSATSEKMAASYAGEEASLSEKIKQLSASLEASLNTLSRGLDESSSALQLAANLRQDQKEQHDSYAEKLDRVSEELNEITETLRVTGKNFTQESATYVNQTLKSFDNGLAEVVERLIFTASAIRDAVDALPVALRSGKDQ